MINELLNTIRSTILKKTPEIQSRYIYNKQCGAVSASAVFLEIANYEIGDEPATEKFKH